MATLFVLFDVVCSPYCLALIKPCGVLRSWTRDELWANRTPAHAQ